MKVVVSNAPVCSKPSSEDAKLILTRFEEFVQQVDKVEGVTAFRFHAKTLKEFIGGVMWVLSEAPCIVLKGAIEAGEYNANKFRTLKVHGHNEWYTVLKDAMKVLDGYCKERHEMGLQFSFNGGVSWAEALSRGGQAAPSQPSAAPSAPAHAGAEAAPSKVANKPKKSPKRNQIGVNWFLEHFEGEELTLASPDIKMNQGVVIENLNRCVVHIRDKCRSVVIGNSKEIELRVTNCVSGIEVMNCNTVYLYVLDKVPTISIDASENVKIILNRKNPDCEILSSKANALTVTSADDEGNERKEFPVTVQFLTKWNAGQGEFETTAYEHR